MQDLKIALIQTDLVWENPIENRQQLDTKISEIKNKPDLIILPEMFSTGFTMNVDDCAEKEKGNTLDWMKRKAKENKCVIAGSQLVTENEKFFNRMFWVTQDGAYKKYDKRHLFRMANEHHIMAQGVDKTIAELKGWRFLLQICYDLRFPVFSKNNFSNNCYDYDAIIYVSNWPEIRNQAYKSLLLARAIENQSYVIWINRVGKDGNGIFHSGDSMVVDPTGKIQYQANSGKEQTIIANLDAAHLNNFRQKFKVGLDWDKFTLEN